MTGRLIASIVVVVLIVGVIGAGYVMSRRGSKDVEVGRPDRISEEVVTGLMSELRKSQAEVNYWKKEAERLQKEVDRR